MAMVAEEIFLIQAKKYFVDKKIVFPLQINFFFFKKFFFNQKSDVARLVPV